jgi:hypothetical protein
MARRLVTHRCAERAQQGARGHVSVVQFGGPRRDELHPNAALATLDDERTPVEPYAVGEARQQRAHRSKNASAGQVCAGISSQRAPVDQHGYRSSRWE